MYDFCRYCWELDGDDEPIKQYYDKLKLGAMFFEAFTRDDRLCHLGYGDSEVAINEMSAVGSLLIIALSLNMLGLTKIKVMNYVPAIFIPIFLVMFMK